jgi:NAD(P)-dependent dehydrogenase (short-subunit alcohol dehydrogenase family)
MAGTILITGTSSGIGAGLAAASVATGWQVYGISRRPGPAGLGTTYHHACCDLADTEAVAPALVRLLADVRALDVVVLNAGVLGEVRDLAATPLADLERLMSINVWANKTVLDWLFAGVPVVDQVVAISSGAAVNGNRGWGGYSISKAALNMLVKLYAAERPATHFTALAPGLVDTAMQAYLCGGDVDADRFPSVSALQAARGTAAMPDPGAFAEQFLPLLPRLRDEENGAFVDVRALG